MRVLFPGSFDPFTLGHLDLLLRAVAVADSVVVGVARNPGKSPLFSEKERLALLSEACSEVDVEVGIFEGLVVDAAREVGAGAIVRGVRSSEEYAREAAMARMNRSLTGVETILIPADGAVAHISSGLVKEIARFGGDIAAFVPRHVMEAVYAKLGR